MKTFKARNTAQVVRRLANNGKVYVTFPTGTAGHNFNEVLTRKLNAKHRKDGTVTVQAFRAEWKLNARVVFHPECRKDNGSAFRAFLSVSPEFVRFLS